MCSTHASPGSAFLSRRELRLAVLDRERPQVLAVEFDQIERIDERRTVIPAGAERLEVRDAVFATADQFAIDHERLGREPTSGGGNGREAVCPIVSAAREQAHPRPFPADRHAKAVELDLVQPAGTDDSAVTR